MTVRAIGKLGDHQIDAEVINPGDWWGKVWLIEIGHGISSSYFAVEGDTLQHALDEFADSAYGHLIHIDIDVEGGDYGCQMSKGDTIKDGVVLEEDSWVNLKGEISDTSLSECSYYGNAGTPCDTDHMTYHGDERTGWKCVYFDPNDQNCRYIDPEIYTDREKRFLIATPDHEGQDEVIGINFRSDKHIREWLISQKLNWRDFKVSEQDEDDIPEDYDGVNAHFFEKLTPD